MIAVSASHAPAADYFTREGYFENDAGTWFGVAQRRGQNWFAAAASTLALGSRFHPVSRLFLSVSPSAQVFVLAGVSLGAAQAAMGVSVSETVVSRSIL